MVRLRWADGRDELALLREARTGDECALGELCRRHRAVVFATARSMTRSVCEADDIAAEAFAKVLAALAGGRGPERDFRAYVLAAVRSVAYDRARRRREIPRGLMGEFFDLERDTIDPHAGFGDARLVAAAFASLPPRWRAVLWYTAVEGLVSSDVAGHFGVSPNAAAALAGRAREALRLEYLRLQLADVSATNLALRPPG